jgi:hypothetical protein
VPRGIAAPRQGQLAGPSPGDAGKAIAIDRFAGAAADQMRHAPGTPRRRAATSPEGRRSGSDQPADLDHRPDEIGKQRMRRERLPWRRADDGWNPSVALTPKSRKAV